MEFAYDDGGLAKGGTVTLYLDGEKVGEGRVDQTEPFAFSADEICDIGSEAGSPVSEDYGPRGNEFTGEFKWVEIDLGEDAEDADHYIDPEERLRVYMAIQWDLFDIGGCSLKVKVASGMSLKISILIGASTE